MNAREIAERFGVSKKTVYNWVERGLPCYRQPRGISLVLRFDADEVDRWLTDQRKVSGQ